MATELTEGPMARKEKNLGTALITLACLLSPLWIGALIKLLSNNAASKRESERQSRLCPHNVPGGETLDRCPSCVGNKQKAAALEEKKKELEALKREVALRAEALDMSEKNRIHLALLKDIDRLEAASPRHFEDFVSHLFRMQGYEVQQTPYVNDAGKDAIMQKGGEKFLVECKRYEKSSSVGRPELQKFFAAIHDEQAVKGFFVTTAHFSSGAREYAATHPIELIDRDDLYRLIANAFPTSNADLRYERICRLCGQKVAFTLGEAEGATLSRPCPRGHPVDSLFRLADFQVAHATPPRVCPKCGRPLRLIKPRGGGTSFFGCTGYPGKCRYTESARDFDRIDGKCPKCGRKLRIVRHTKSGRPFIGCSGYPDCTYIARSK